MANRWLPQWLRRRPKPQQRSAADRWALAEQDVSQLHITVQQDVLPPSVPTGLTVSPVSQTQLDIAWNASTDTLSGVAGYRIYRDGVLLVDQPGRTYSDTGLALGTTHGYRVAAYDAVGNVSAQCAVVNGTTQDFAAPSVPTGLTATPYSQTQINLSWNASTDVGVGVAGYRVYRDGAQIQSQPGLSYSDTGLAVGSAHAYQVLAFDVAGNTSALCLAVNATTPDTTAPTVPSGLTATVISSSQINLSWNASTDVGGGMAGYRLYRDGTLIATQATRTFSDTGLTPGSLHSYQVLAYDLANNASALCTAVTATTQAGGTVAGGLALDPGFGIIGTFAYEQQVTLTSANSVFGAGAPELACFDDFRARAIGDQVTEGMLPVAGYATWHPNNGTVSTSWIFERTDRSGLHPSASLLNNEVCSDPAVNYGRKANLMFGKTVQSMYFEYHESWRSNWGGGNDSPGSGGGYYKHNWALWDTTYGANGVDLVLPNFAAQSAGSPADVINMFFGGNSNVNNGGPIPALWLVAGTSSGFAKWDHDGWNSVEASCSPQDPASPYGNCLWTFTLYNAVNQQAIDRQYSSAPMYVSSPANFAGFTQLQMPGLMQSMLRHTVDRGGIFVQTGPYCRKRIFLGDAPTLAACTKTASCTPVSWSANSVTIIPRQSWPGMLDSTVYVYGSDENNNRYRIGQCTGMVAPDFYASPTGSDANPGTRAQPWAKTWVNSKRATYRGKTVGLLPGTYPLSSMMTATSGDIAWDVDGGSALASTVVVSCDANGNYSRGTAILAANDNGIFGGGNGNAAAIIGQGHGSTNKGYVRFKGLTVSGGSCYVGLIGDTQNLALGPYPGVVWEEIDFTGNSLATTTRAGGTNCSLITHFNTQGMQLIRCKFHDNAGPGASGDYTHYSVTYAWSGSYDTLFEYCSIYNQFGGFHGKESNIQGTEIRYCYIDCSSISPSGANRSAVMGFDGYSQAGLTHTTKIHHNIIKIAYQGLNLESELGGGGWTTPCEIYNNTFVNGSAGVIEYIRFFTSAAGQKLLKLYNNGFIYNGNLPPSNYGSIIVNSDALAVSDYNDWGGSASWSTVPPGAHSSAGFTHHATLAAFAAAIGGLEANSTNSSASGVTNNGAYALTYQTTPGGKWDGTGRVGGVSGGAVCNKGAWDVGVTQIGCNF